MNIKEIDRQFKQLFAQQQSRNGCLKCNGQGEIAVQENGKFKSIPCGCDERQHPTVSI